MKLNELGDWIHDEDRGVSPVIGVILMVAITVILAAVIAAFVLDLGQSQGANAQVGLDFTHDGSSTSVDVTITSVERADELWISCGGTNYQDGASAWASDPSAGESYTIEYDAGESEEDCGGETIQIIGLYEGNENVVTQYDDHN